MEPIVSGISAWQYWSTAPIVRDVDIPQEDACAKRPHGGGLPEDFFRPRVNRCELLSFLAEHLLGDLKGAQLPIHIMADRSADRHKSDLCKCRLRPHWISRDDYLHIGSELSVLTPEATLLSLALENDEITLALKICEAAGLYAVANETPLYNVALEALLGNDVISKDEQRARREHINEYYDANGHPVSFLSRSGHSIPWELSFDRNGLPTDLWKRAPLLAVEDLQLYAQSKAGEYGAKKLLSAARLAQNGLESPLESKAMMLMCAGAWRGGEGWPAPWLNRRIEFEGAARELAGRSHCVCDQLWLEQKVVIEVNGLAYHADRQGFILKSGRTAALESLGYRVIDLDYEQMYNLDQWDARVEVISQMLGLPLKKRTPAFIRRQRALHKELFD